MVLPFIDPGTIMGLGSLLSDSGMDLNSILSRVLGMAGGTTDPAELLAIEIEMEELAAKLAAGAKELKERRLVLSNLETERDALHADADKSHNDLLDAMHRRKEREANPEDPI